MTVQGIPEGVRPPVVTALGSSLLQMTWSEPKHPGGIIQRYRLNQTGVGTIFTHYGGPKSYTVTGKDPSLSQPSDILILSTFSSLLMQLLLSTWKKQNPAFKSRRAVLISRNCAFSLAQLMKGTI